MCNELVCMKAIILFGCYCIVHVAPAFGQVVRVKSITSWTVPATKQSSLDHELRKFLLFMHEADGSTQARALFKVPLLVTTKYPGIGVYKFGLYSAHDGYDVVFQYRNHLVFSSARSSRLLLTQLRNFLTQYPTAFGAAAQRTAEGQLTGIVEHNQTAGETDLPSRQD